MCASFSNILKVDGKLIKVVNSACLIRPIQSPCSCWKCINIRKFNTVLTVRQLFEKNKWLIIINLIPKRSRATKDNTTVPVDLDDTFTSYCVPSAIVNT